MTNARDKSQEVFLLPEGRVINSHVFVRNIYKDQNGGESKPQYSMELAFDPAQVEGDGNAIEDTILGYIDFISMTDDKAKIMAARGDLGQMYLDGKVHGPFIDGNVLADNKKAAGKPGDAYEGKLVARPNTQFNRAGNIGEGGIDVFGPDLKVLGLDLGNSDLVYNGCYGVAKVKLGHYFPSTGGLGVKFYLVAFQKTRDGEPLKAPRDNSTLFEAVGGAATPAAAAAGTARRRRAG